MRCLIALGLLLSLLAGCGSDGTRQTHTREVVTTRTETHPTADGGSVVTTKTIRDENQSEESHSEVDLTPPPPVMSALGGIATGGWADVAAGVSSLVFGGYGLIKHRENTKLKAKAHSKPQVTTTV